MVIRLLLLACNVSSVFVNNLFCNSNKNVFKKNRCVVLTVFNRESEHYRVCLFGKEVRPGAKF